MRQPSELMHCNVTSEGRMWIPKERSAWMYQLVPDHIQSSPHPHPSVSMVSKSKPIPLPECWWVSTSTALLQAGFRAGSYLFWDPGWRSSGKLEHVLLMLKGRCIGPRPQQHVSVQMWYFPVWCISLAKDVIRLGLHGEDLHCFPRGMEEEEEYLLNNNANEKSSSTSHFVS